MVTFHYMFAKSWIFGFLLSNGSLMFFQFMIQVVFSLANIHKFTITARDIVNYAGLFIGRYGIFGWWKVLAHNTDGFHGDFNEIGVNVLYLLSNQCVGWSDFMCLISKQKHDWQTGADLGGCISPPQPFSSMFLIITIFFIISNLFDDNKLYAL